MTSSAPPGASPTAAVAPAEAPATKQRLEHIDAMRPVKQAGVVSTHTLLAFAPLATLSAGGALLLLHVTREAFLFVSACMLTYGYRELKRHDYRRFYRRRAVSVVVPYLCWTLIYFGLTLPGEHLDAWGAFGHFWYLAGTGYYQLYYLLVIIEFYVVFPFALALLRRTRRHGLVVGVSLGLQVVLVSAIHYGVVPNAFQGFWATRELTSYQLYLVAGMVVALHLREVHDWLLRHVRAIVALTLVGAVVAEAWFVAASDNLAGWLGSGSDPLQPIVIPFNLGAIAGIYLIGVYLVGERRSPRLRAVVRSGSDNSYGIFLAQMVMITVLGWLGWRDLSSVLSWPALSLLTVPVVVLACVLLTSLLARTRLSVALTGRQRASWSSWLPAAWRPAAAAAPASVASHPAPSTTAPSTGVAAAEDDVRPVSEPPRGLPSRPLLVDEGQPARHNRSRGERRRTSEENARVPAMSA